MEKDDDIKGAGNSYTTEFRQYDPRLGRWTSLDPLLTLFPDQSPYVAFDNNPISSADETGAAAEDFVKLPNGEIKNNSEVNSQSEAVAWYGEGAEWIEPGSAQSNYTSSSGQNVVLGSNGSFTINGAKKLAPDNAHYIPVDNDYTEQAMNRRLFHEKVMANADAVSNFVMGMGAVMLAPLAVAEIVLPLAALAPSINMPTLGVGSGGAQLSAEGAAVLARSLFGVKQAAVILTVATAGTVAIEVNLVQDQMHSGSDGGGSGGFEKMKQGNNTKKNEEAKSLFKKYNLNKKQQRDDLITKQGYSRKEIEEVIIEYLGL